MGPVHQKAVGGAAWPQNVQFTVIFQVYSSNNCIFFFFGFCPYAVATTAITKQKKKKKTAKEGAVE